MQAAVPTVSATIGATTLYAFLANPDLYTDGRRHVNEAALVTSTTM